MSDRNIRVSIQAISELPLVADQLNELIKLTKQHQEISQQAALSARTGSIQQIEAIQGITTAAKEQQVQQKKAASEYEDLVKNANKQINEAGNQVRTFATLVATAFATDKLMSFGQDVIQAKTQIDNLKISLDVMLGSKAESAKLYKEIVSLAKETPFTLEEVANNVTKLKAFNIATSELIPTVNALGNIAAAVGKDKLPQITLAYGQIMNMGKLMGGEIKQLVEAGIPLYDLLADSMKKPKAEVIALAADHKIMAADVKKAIMETSEAGGRYYGLMALQSKTVGGEVDKLKDSYQQAKVLIGDFFENTIQAGTRQLNSLMESTIGSNTAIQRSFDVVKSVATAMATYTIATKAQAAADVIVSAYQATKNVLYGEYLLAMRAVTAQQIVFTAAETEAVVAAEAFNIALASNPIGVVITLLGALTAGYFAYKAVTDEVTSSLGEEELKLKSQRQELSDLIITASLAADGTKRRKDAIQLLIDKYPEYFKGINAETATNEQLRGILDKVNASYQIRIDLARQAYKVEQAKSAQTELFKMEDELFARVTKTNVLNEEVIASFNGSAVKLLEYMNANKKAAYDLNTTWTGFYKQSIGQLATDIAKQQSDVTSALGSANKSIQEAKLKQIEADKEAENLRWKNSLTSLKKGSAEYEVAEQAHLDAVAKINGTYREQEVKAVTTHEEKLKSVTLLSAKEIAVLKKEGDAEAEVDRGKQLKAQLDFLNKQEAQEIELINKVQVNKKISASALAALQEQARIKILAIDAEYDKKRAVIQEQIEAETQKAFLVKVQESNDKIAVLTAKRLEAEAMLTRLNDAKTSEERLAALKLYNTKFTENVKQAALEQLKVQVDASKKALDDIVDANGEKGDAYRKAYAAWLKDNEAYNTALTDSTVTAAKDTAKQLKEYEKQIQDSKKETAKIEKETLEQSRKTRAEVLAGLAQLVSQEGGFLGQMGASLISIYNNIDGLQLKTLAASKNAVKSAQDALAGIKMIYSDGSAEGDAAVAKGTEAFAKAKENLAEAEGVTAGAIMSIVGVASQIIFAIGQAQAQAKADVYFAIAGGLEKAREAYKFFYAYVIQAGKDSHDAEMEVFKGTLDEKLSRIKDYYAQEKQLTSSKEKIEQELLYYQKSAEIRANLFVDAKAAMQGMKELREAQWQWEVDKVVSQAEIEKREAKEKYDTRVAYLNAELDAFREAKNAEMDADREAADTAISKIQEVRDAKIDGINAQIDAIKTALDIEVQKVRDAYDTELTALKTKEDQEQAAIKATYDLKQSLLAQATADQIEEINIIDRVRLDALGRYENDERARITATRDRILATLTDENERAQVTAYYEQQLSDLHTKVEDGKLDKSKGVSLATTQLNREAKEEAERLKTEETNTLTTLANNYQTLFTNLANERDATLTTLKNDAVTREGKLRDEIKTIQSDSKTEILKIQTDLKDEIKRLKDQILQKEDETTAAKKRLNYEYKTAVLQANAQIFEAQRSMLIAQLQAQIAVLNSQKSWTGIGNGKINDAINTIQDSINQLGGIVFNTAGSVAEYLDAYDMNKFGLPKKVISNRNGASVLDIPVFDKDGNPIEVTYKESDQVFVVYDKDKNPFNISQVSGYIPATGERFFKGTDYVEGRGLPDGRDTVPAMINKGERILPTDDNLRIGGRNLTNGQLVEKITNYDKLMTDFPKYAALMMPQGGVYMKLPDNIMNSQGGNTIDVSSLEAGLKRVERAVQSKKLVAFNIDQRGLHMAEETHQSKVNYYSKLMQG